MICLDYWHIFANDLYSSETAFGAGAGGPLNLGGAGNGAAMGGVGGGSRKHLYQQELLTRVRTVMISNMAKPEEVLVVEDDDGDVRRQQVHSSKLSHLVTENCLAKTKNRPLNLEMPPYFIYRSSLRSMSL